MQETPSQIAYRELVAHLQESRVEPRRWYVGISSQPDHDLFAVHKVKSTDHFLKYDVESQEDAISVRNSICKNFGAQGDTHVGEPSTTFVYCYIITDHTRQ